MIFLLNYVPLLCENGPNASFICSIDAAFDGLKWLAFKQCMYFFWSVRKNILKEPQENKRPTKEYRGGHKQRENTRENKSKQSRKN